MSSEKEVAVSFLLPAKSVARVDKLALEYALSRGNTLKKLVEQSLIDHGEPIENNTVTFNGEKRRNGVPRIVNNTLRKIL